jgi:hypothetical protein
LFKQLILLNSQKLEAWWWEKEGRGIKIIQYT